MVNANFETEDNGNPQKEEIILCRVVERPRGFHEAATFELGLGKQCSVPGREAGWRVSPGRGKSMMTNDMTDMIWTQGMAVTGMVHAVAGVWGPSVCTLARGG